MALSAKHYNELLAAIDAAADGLSQDDVADALLDIAEEQADADQRYAKRLYQTAANFYAQSHRTGQPNDAWFDLANAIYVLWPEVAPDGFSKSTIVT